ncbi:MAG: hypothetical protein N3G20_11990, partial [Verrucomicrobiae bacterium]|nr:hypothetical protein [Verrucomicrobiae bacterium]
MWARSEVPLANVHPTWQYLLENGKTDQVQRLKDDLKFQIGGPVLTVVTDPDGTRGFSVNLDQLKQHKAMWFAEHDAFVTVADAPVGFSAHLASLKGERVLDKVKREPEATFADWAAKWEDVGNPNQYDKPWETTYMGVKGHLTGFVASHGSAFKFGIDRWGNVRPDLGSPHRFRLDLVWQGSKWEGQRLVDGLPILLTTLKKNGLTCEMEQFAASLTQPVPEKQGKNPGALLTMLRISGNGPLDLVFRFCTESTNIQPELRKIGDRACIVEAKTGVVMLMIEAGGGLTVYEARVLGTETGPALEIGCIGEISPGQPRTILVKLPSPPASGATVGILSELDFARARGSVVSYWRGWLSRGAQFDVPEQRVNELYRANLWHALGLPRYRTDAQGEQVADFPYSNFAYGQAGTDWPINQAVYVDYMIYGLRGYFSLAEEELRLIFTTQQHTDGRIVGYGEWGVNSPAMLY